MSSRALYAGSFDPITSGHLDIIARAARMFDHVVIAIGHNPKKPGLFSITERADLVKKACKGIKNVSVTSFTGLTAEFAHKEKCNNSGIGMHNETCCAAASPTALPRA